MPTTPVCAIDANGIHAPTYGDCLAYFQGTYRGIYGQDVYLGNDSQDGQFLALLAQALHDANSATVAVYNAFSPSTAQGSGLSSVVKINGIARNVPTASRVDLRIIGVAGSQITNGIARDTNNKQWLLPASVVVPPAGEITVTALASDLGAIQAPPNTVTTIGTPTYGWQSVTNPAAATPGAPVESDPQLKARQTVSTALPALTPFEAMLGAIASLPGVERYRGYENDADVIDDNGLPGHCVAFVVDGGDALAVASAIAARKTPGANTYGSTTEPITDAYGITRNVNFFRPTDVPIYYSLTVKALAGFTVDIAGAIRQAISDWTNGLGIGNGVPLMDAYMPARLYGGPNAGSFKIVPDTFIAGRDSASLAADDLLIAFNEAAVCDPAYINLVVTT